jgi:ABC-type bacteriocin/lantibiotic exporter with double-glycine peptidase domain
MNQRRSAGCARALTLLAGSFASAQLVVAMDATPLKVPFHRQETNGCGPASVEMLQGYWSAHRAGLAQPPESELHASLPVSENQGTLLSDMRRYLDSKGYHAFTIQADPTDLTRQISKGRVPIVALKSKAKANADLHYVVVTGLDQRKVWLNDPAKRGPGSVDRSKFEESWTRAGNWMLLAVPRGVESE